MQIAVLGIDLGKNSCSVVGLDASGRVVLRRRLQREGVVKLAAGLPGCVMAMEACCGANHLGRRLRDQGHICDPHGCDLGDEAFNGDDLLAGCRADGGFKMIEATRFEAGHRT